MPSPTVITPERFSQGDTYEEYVNQLGDTRPRFTEHEAAFHLDSGEARYFQEAVKRNGQVKVIAIVEDWCPDVHRGLPVMSAIAKAAGMELRVFPRDKNPDLMDLYLKNGEFRSIPVFAFFDGQFKPLCHWIERPVAATRYMEQVAAELSERKLTEEELRQARRQRSQSMADTWRQETVAELKDLLASV